MIWQLSLRFLLPRRYEMGKRYVEGDKKGDKKKAMARSVYANGATDHPLRRSMSTACV